MKSKKKKRHEVIDDGSWSSVPPVVLWPDRVGPIRRYAPTSLLWLLPLLRRRWLAPPHQVLPVLSIAFPHLSVTHFAVSHLPIAHLTFPAHKLLAAHGSIQLLLLTLLLLLMVLLLLNVLVPHMFHPAVTRKRVSKVARMLFLSWAAVQRVVVSKRGVRWMLQRGRWAVVGSR
jgi:hypothetical protein